VDTKDSYEELIAKIRSKSDSFEIVNAIAKGGMGQVSLAKDKTIQRNIAVKVLHKEYQDDQDMCRHFIDEARITGQLEHSNIVPVHTVGIDQDDTLYFTMKFVDGDSLLAIIEQLNNRNEEYRQYYTQFMLLRTFRKVCDAVSFAHSKNILHRDIKPENIMIGDFGEVLLMDWGLAKHENSKETKTSETIPSSNPLQTVDGTIKGSPAYMSPEQARGESGEYDTRSDIFLLGATLYHMITLKTPYFDKDVNTMVSMAENCQFTPPSDVSPEKQIPDELCSIITKAMHIDKEKRYQTVEEFTQAIDKLMSGQIASTSARYKAGEDIIRHGESAAEAYVIVEGEVEVYKKFAGKKTVYTRLHAGDVFGEMAAIGNTERSASVCALTDTTCLIITPDTLKEQLNKLPPWLEKIVSALSQRLRSMGSMAHPLLISDCTYEVCNQLKLLVMCYGVVDENNCLVHNLPEIIYEISNNLKIPEERVRPVIAGLTEIDLAEITNDLNLIMPNWNLFSDFVEYCKDARRLSTTSTRNLTSVNVHKVYTDGASVILRHSRVSPNEKMPPLKTMKLLKDRTSSEDALQYKKIFKEKMQTLCDYATKSEALNKSLFNRQIERHVFNPAKAPKISTKFLDS
jgi:eukaryotic-like serine/threonine-protein kinase